jgi:hypothetical protein
MSQVIKCHDETGPCIALMTCDELGSTSFPPITYKLQGTYFTIPAKNYLIPDRTRCGIALIVCEIEAGNLCLGSIFTNSFLVNFALPLKDDKSTGKSVPASYMQIGVSTWPTCQAKITNNTEDFINAINQWEELELCTPNPPVDGQTCGPYTTN